MATTWKTKYGLRRVRHDPPTLAEAIEAAQGLTDDRAQQAALAADLLGVPLAQVQAEMLRLNLHRRVLTIVAPSRDKVGARTIVVERKTSRRLGPGVPSLRAVQRIG